MLLKPAFRMFVCRLISGLYNERLRFSMKLIFSRYSATVKSPPWSMECEILLKHNLDHAFII